MSFPDIALLILPAKAGDENDVTMAADIIAREDSIASAFIRNLLFVKPSTIVVSGNESQEKDNDQAVECDTAAQKGGLPLFYPF